MEKVFAVKIDSSNFTPAGKFSSISSIIDVVLPNIFLLAGMIFTAMIVYSGFRLMQGGEKPEELAKIKTLFVTSGVGIAIIFGSYFLVKIIASLLNINNLPF